MGFSFDVSVPVFTVFLQGLISFFSPCILPLIPLYIGYLSGGTGDKGRRWKNALQRSKVMLHTFCFVLGVSFAFFLLGFGFSAMGEFFKSNQVLFARLGGILVAFLGLYQLGVFGNSRLLGQERRLPLKLNVLAMSPLTALVMGFTFSFAWTPWVCRRLPACCLWRRLQGTNNGIFAYWRVYHRFCTSISGSGNLYYDSAGIFQKSRKSCALYRKGRRYFNGSYGCFDVYWKNECCYRISVRRVF